MDAARSLTLAKTDNRLFGLTVEAKQKLVQRMIDGRSDRRIQAPAAGPLATGPVRQARTPLTGCFRMSRSLVIG